MELIQNTYMNEPAPSAMVAYVNQTAPSEIINLPYSGAKSVHLPLGEWGTDAFDFSFTCFDKQTGKTYVETRSALEIEKNDSSQMFFYAAIPGNIYPFSDSCTDVTVTIRELMMPITEACHMNFDGGSSPIGSNSSRIETHGKVQHDELGNGEWKAEIQKSGGSYHVLMSISFNELDNEAFFQQIQQDYLF